MGIKISEDRKKHILYWDEDNGNLILNEYQYTIWNSTSSQYDVSLVSSNIVGSNNFINVSTNNQSPIISGYRVNGNTQKAYKLIRPTTTFATSANNIVGESIYATSFQCTPNQIINEIAFNVQSAGSAGTGLAQARILIYRAKLNANGELIGGDLELDTNVDISTLTTGIKVITGLNHTLSSNTYKDYWYMAIRNYQSGNLSIKCLDNTNVVSTHSSLSTLTVVENRDMTWFWFVPYTSSTPTSMPQISGAGFSASFVSEYTQIPMIGYSD
jgi:hypothetical protein